MPAVLCLADSYLWFSHGDGNAVTYRLSVQADAAPEVTAVQPANVGSSGTSSVTVTGLHFGSSSKTPEPAPEADR